MMLPQEPQVSPDDFSTVPMLSLQGAFFDDVMRSNEREAFISSLPVISHSALPAQAHCQEVRAVKAAQVMARPSIDLSHVAYRLTVYPIKFSIILLIVVFAILREMPLVFSAAKS